VSPQQGTREIKHIRKIINVWKSKGLKMLPCETPIEHTVMLLSQLRCVT